MYRPGHHGAAMLVYAPIAGGLLATGHGLLALAGCVVVIGGTMVPDYDRRSPRLQRRGLTHTVWFAFFFGGALGLAGAAAGSWFRGTAAAAGLFLFGFLGGALAILVHIVADALTPGGVQPFTPLRDDTYAYGLSYAISPPANYVLLGVGSLAVAFALLLGNAVAA